ncbi:3-keto-5-aminohexanoate cleavage protein [Gluconacetobacter tumulisoli]|uniref:3-keto-5-aminohexanoate cleavage protein n=1 Tax=Gluconacetobacter tumulisoli TaxID=1286189 RepID=A0A7W4K507_9PROT|nr:3-keto-5-aminohexanoate cleavage protein [Gluconacetobacter tumulisoli]
MIIQACLNGARPKGFHPSLPLTAEDMARDGAACVSAGAAELHFHPRVTPDREGLAAVDETILAVRKACPGTLLGVSTGAWIEGDEHETRSRIAAWRHPPDYASVNLAESDAPAIMELLRQRHIGIEAGLATAADAERFVRLRNRDGVLRVLVEIEEQDFPSARRAAEDIVAILERSDIGRPVLLHGLDATMWPLLELARRRRWSTRIGLEDGRFLGDGSVARDNPHLVAEAVRLFRRDGGT